MSPPSHTAKPRPEPVVVTVEEPVQDPGENGAVVDGRRLRVGQAEPIREEKNGRAGGTRLVVVKTTRCPTRRGCD